MSDGSEVSNVISQTVISQLQNLIDQVKQRSNADEVRIIASQEYKDILKTSFPNESVDCDMVSDDFPSADNIFIVPRQRPSPVTLIIDTDLDVRIT